MHPCRSGHGAAPAAARLRPHFPMGGIRHLSGHLKPRELSALKKIYKFSVDLFIDKVEIGGYKAYENDDACELLDRVGGTLHDGGRPLSKPGGFAASGIRSDPS